MSASDPWEIEQRKCLCCGKNHVQGPWRVENGVPICSETPITRPSTLARVLARAPEYEQLDEQGVLDEVASRRSGEDIGALRKEIAVERAAMDAAFAEHEKLDAQREDTLRYWMSRADKAEAEIAALKANFAIAQEQVRMVMEVRAEGLKQIAALKAKLAEAEQFIGMTAQVRPAFESTLKNLARNYVDRHAEAQRTEEMEALKAEVERLRKLTSRMENHLSTKCPDRYNEGETLTLLKDIRALDAAKKGG